MELYTLSNITALKFVSETASLLRNLTFLYDANWSPDGTNSLPFAFFHITKQEEILRNDVSTKRVILHSFGATESVLSNATGVLSVVSDNIVPQPKAWRLSVVVPMNAILPFLEEAEERIETGLRFASTAVTDSLGSGMASLMNTAASGMTVLRLLTKLFTVSADIVNYFTKDVTKWDVADYNRDSLEAMCRNRSILRMKEWSGWTYKYGVITSCTLSKEPLEESYYKGTIDFQEMPILYAKQAPGYPVDPGKGILQAAFKAKQTLIEGVLLR